MPYDNDFPDDCDDDNDGPCPDPDRDQDTLTDALLVVDGLELDDGDASNDLTPFRLNVAEHKIRVGNHGEVGAAMADDGLVFIVGGQARTIEWGWHSNGSRWHTHRVSFDKGDLVTVGPAL